MNDDARKMLVDALIAMFERAGETTIDRRSEVLAMVGEHRGEPYATTFEMTSPMGRHKVTVEELDA